MDVLFVLSLSICLCVSLNELRCTQTRETRRHNEEAAAVRKLSALGHPEMFGDQMQPLRNMCTIPRRPVGH